MRKIDFHIHTSASILDADFEFSLAKLVEYVDTAQLDCIAITNHNLFDRSQFEEIRDRLNIAVYPGIEVSLEKGQILVISDGTNLSSFDAACEQVTATCQSPSDTISIDDFKTIFGDLSSYILIPHYEKKPPIDDQTLAHLAPHVSAGEVSSPKKFVYCVKNENRLVPVYFSDCRMKHDLAALPIRQTFLDCSDVTFNAVKECLRDKSKVALSKEDGNELFQVLEDGLQISTALNVVLGDRSSGKTYTLNAIKERFPNAYHIEQFALVARNDTEDEEKFNRYLSQKQGLFSKEYLSELQRVIEDVIDIDLDSDDRNVERYISTLLAFAKETEKHDSFSKARIYSEEPFSERDQKGLETLIDSTKNLISNVEFKETVEKHLDRSALISLYVDLIHIYEAREQVRLKKRWVNDLMKRVKAQLQLRTAAPQIADLDLYDVAMNKRKIARFSQISKLARAPNTAKKEQRRGFSVVANVGPFGGAGEISAVIRRKVAFRDAYAVYGDPYKFLQELKKIVAPLEQADFAKCFVKINYQILNKDGFAASGGERSEFFLLDKIEGANEYDMLLIDEPESSFDNTFLHDDVNSIIKDLSKTMPVVVVTHNNTVGVSIQPNYILYTKKDIEDGEIVWRTYAGHPTSKVLASPDGRSVQTWDVLMGNLEAGSAAYEQRRQTYENLKD